MKTTTWRRKYPEKTCKWCGTIFQRSHMETATNWKKKTLCSQYCKARFINKIRSDILKKKLGLRSCAMCGIPFQPNNQVQIYCGSKSKKEGCSWKNQIEKKKKYMALYRLNHKNNFLWTGLVKLNRGI